MTGEDLPRIKETIGKLRGSKDRVWDLYLDRLWMTALAKAGGKGWADDIIAALQKEPSDIPLMEALARTGDPRAVEILQRNLCIPGSKWSHNPGYAGYRAACALLNFGQHGVQVVIEALRSPSPWVRSAAASAFADSDTTDIPVELLEDIAASDPSTKAVFYAKLALYRLRKRRRKA